METKLIKEEAPDRDSGTVKDTCRRQPTPPTSVDSGPPRGRHKGVPKERVKTPDSPEGARLMLGASTPSSLLNHSNSTSPTHGVSTTAPTTPTPTPTPTPMRYAASGLHNGGGLPGVPGNASPAMNGSGGSGGSPTPPLPASAALSLSMMDAQNTATSGMRTLGKMKRFLSTLVQFGGDIAPDTGDRVRSLVFSLVGNSITIEEFHHSLQDVTNFPLRPFVVPFLRAHLPQLQRELANLARAAKQTPQQYLRHHEHVVLDPAFSPSEPSEIFHSEVNENGKRRASNSYYENGATDTCTDYSSPSKRVHPLLLQHAPGLLYSPAAAPGHPHVPPPPHLHSSADFPQTFYHASYGAQPCREDYLVERRHGDDEWKNIHVMLNCILSMVEKTKRALAILQHRGGGGGGGVGEGVSADWLRRPAAGDGSDARDVKRTAGEIMAQTIRVTEDRVAEVKRRAEEAVNEVKRQAVAELHRAVTAAESKACELVATERAKMEKLLLEARKQAAEEALAAVAGPPLPPPEAADAAAAAAPPPTQQNSCWNCGRKANETCSGCNMARYCGAFCQHKDWENHHQICCGRNPVNPLNASPVEKPQPTRSASSSRSGTPVTASSTANALAVADVRSKK